MSDEYKQDRDSAVGAPMEEFSALQAVIGALQSLDNEARNRILDSAATFLGISVHTKDTYPLMSTQPSPVGTSSTVSRMPFSDETQMSPKEFLMEKAPKTDVERIACLAYYLTHYRSTPHFKTLDLSLLNTESAQPKFSNTAYSANNAVKLGYIVSSTKGSRQISAMGERFVQALPDRTAAKDVLVSLRRKQRSKRKRSPSEGTIEE